MKILEILTPAQLQEYNKLDDDKKAIFKKTLEEQLGQPVDDTMPDIPGTNWVERRGQNFLGAAGMAVAGVGQAALDYIPGAPAAAEGFKEVTGADPQEFLNSVSSTSQERLREAQLYGMLEGDGYGADVVDAGLKLAPAITAAILAKNPALGIDIMASQAGAETYAGAIANGDTPGVAALKGAKTALLERLTEKYGAAPGALGKIMEARKAGKKLDVFKEAGLGALQEAGEESVNSLANTALDEVMFGEGKPAWEALKEAGYEGAVAAPIGAGFRGISAASDLRAKAIKDKFKDIINNLKDDKNKEQTLQDDLGTEASAKDSTTTDKAVTLPEDYSVDNPVVRVGDKEYNLLTPLDLEGVDVESAIALKQMQSELVKDAAKAAGREFTIKIGGKFFDLATDPTLAEGFSTLAPAVQESLIKFYNNIIKALFGDLAKKVDEFIYTQPDITGIPDIKDFQGPMPAEEPITSPDLGTEAPAVDPSVQPDLFAGEEPVTAPELGTEVPDQAPEAPTQAEEASPVQVPEADSTEGVDDGEIVPEEYIEPVDDTGLDESVLDVETVRGKLIDHLVEEAPKATILFDGAQSQDLKLASDIAQAVNESTSAEELATKLKERLAGSGSAPARALAKRYGDVIDSFAQKVFSQKAPEAPQTPSETTSPESGAQVPVQEESPVESDTEAPGRIVDTLSSEKLSKTPIKNLNYGQLKQIADELGMKKSGKKKDLRDRIVRVLEYREGKRSLDKYTYRELQALAKELGLKASGKKAELVERIKGGQGETSLKSRLPSKTVRKEQSVPTVFSNLSGSNILDMMQALVRNIKKDMNLSRETRIHSEKVVKHLVKYPPKMIKNLGKLLDTDVFIIDKRESNLKSLPPRIRKDIKDNFWISANGVVFVNQSQGPSPAFILVDKDLDKQEMAGQMITAIHEIVHSAQAAQGSVGEQIENGKKLHDTVKQVLEEVVDHLNKKISSAKTQVEVDELLVYHIKPLEELLIKWGGDVDELPAYASELLLTSGTLYDVIERSYTNERNSLFERLKSALLRLIAFVFKHIPISYSPYSSKSASLFAQDERIINAYADLFARAREVKKGAVYKDGILQTTNNAGVVDKDSGITDPVIHKMERTKTEEQKKSVKKKVNTLRKRKTISSKAFDFLKRWGTYAGGLPDATFRKAERIRKGYSKRVSALFSSSAYIESVRKKLPRDVLVQWAKAFTNYTDMAGIIQFMASPAGKKIQEADPKGMFFDVMIELITEMTTNLDAYMGLLSLVSPERASALATRNKVLAANGTPYLTTDYMLDVVKDWSPSEEAIQAAVDGLYEDTGGAKQVKTLVDELGLSTKEAEKRVRDDIEAKLKGYLLDRQDGGSKASAILHYKGNQPLVDKMIQGMVDRWVDENGLKPLTLTEKQLKALKDFIFKGVEPKQKGALEGDAYIFWQSELAGMKDESYENHDSLKELRNDFFEALEWPDYFRKVWGEIRDPFVKLQSTAAKVANLSANLKWEQVMLSSGMFKDDPEGEHIRRVGANPELKGYKILRNRYTTDEGIEALLHYNRVFRESSKHYTLLKKTNATLKKLLTVWNVPRGVVMNITSAITQLASNGIAISPTEFFQYSASLWKYKKSGVFQNLESQDQVLMEFASKRSLLDGGLFMEEINFEDETNLALSEIDIPPEGISAKAWKKIKDAYDLTDMTLADVFSLPDELGKFYYFKKMVEERMKAEKVSDINSREAQAIMEEVAGETNKVMLNFSELPAFVQVLSRNIAVGTFVSFPAMFMINTYNSYKIGLQELATEGSRVRGAKRLAMSTAIMAAILATLYGRLVNDDKEEGEEQLMGEFYSGASHITNGDTMYVLDSVIPATVFLTPIVKAINGDFKGAFERMFSPFVDVGLGISLYSTVIEGKDSFGRPLSDPGADTGEVIADRTLAAAKKLGGNLVAVRGVKWMLDELVGEGAKEGEGSSILWAAIGVKQIKMDKKALRSAITSTSIQYNTGSRNINKALLDGTIDTEEFSTIVDRELERKADAQAKLYQIYTYLVGTQKKTPEEAELLMIEASRGSSKYMLLSSIAGEVYLKPPTYKNLLKTLDSKAESDKPVTEDELDRRYDLLWEKIDERYEADKSVWQ